jgi:quercetin dioxygenase-like cupin family protein
MKMALPHVVNEADLPIESWDDPARGNTKWRTMFSGDMAQTDSLTGGIAYLDAGGVLEPHHHAQAEVYFILDGDLEVTIDGKCHRAGPNTAFFIPAHVVHGTVNATNKPARLFYCFAADSFSDVKYQFSPKATGSN